MENTIKSVNSLVYFCKSDRTSDTFFQSLSSGLDQKFIILYLFSDV